MPWVKLRYDGKFRDIPGQPRQWTIRSTFIDADGFDRNGSSFGLSELQRLGVVPLILEKVYLFFKMPRPIRGYVRIEIGEKTHE